MEIRLCNSRDSCLYTAAVHKIKIPLCAFELQFLPVNITASIRFKVNI